MITLVEPMSAQPSLEPVWQKLEADRRDADEGHERLRKDYRALDDRLERVLHDQLALARRVQTIEQTPVNVEKMAWTTKQMLVIVSTALMLGGGMWKLHDDQASRARIEDERYEVVNKQLAAALAETRMSELSMQTLTNKLSDYLIQKSK